MRFLSLFSGIEAASVAWGPLGWEAVAFAEIEPFPCAVLAAHYPNVPNLGDVTQIDWEEFKRKYGAVDLVCGGSPCQSFSIAGGREGLDGESRLMFEYIRDVSELRPAWLLWENVPGVFSIDGGRAFGILIDSLEELGYGLAWRTLDAQFFGVAQRRRRCWLVGHLGDMRAAAVLFERDSVSWNTLTSREKRARLTAGTQRHIGESRKGIGFKTDHLSQNGRIYDDSGAAFTVDTTNSNAVMCMSNGQANAEIGEFSPTLNCDHEQPIVCLGSDSSKASIDTDLCSTLHVGGGVAVDCVGALCARDFKGVCNQYVDEGKLICERTC